MRVSPSESTSIPLNVYQSEVENAIGFTDSLGVYNANICIGVWPGELAQSGDNFADDNIFLKKISMFVNGQQLIEIHSLVFFNDYVYESESDDGQTKWPVEPPTICWRAPLDVGLHEAEFQFRQTTGDIQSYTWYFLLTDEEE